MIGFFHPHVVTFQNGYMPRATPVVLIGRHYQDLLFANMNHWTIVQVVVSMVLAPPQTRIAHALLGSLSSSSNCRTMATTTTSTTRAAHVAAANSRQSPSKDGTEAEWSRVALRAAKDMTKSQLAKLRQAGLLDDGVVHQKQSKQPIKIIGEPVMGNDAAVGDDQDSSSGTITKIIHWQRHAQGYHNLICDLWREGQGLDLDSTDPSVNPMVRSEVLDPPLTSLGINQCHARREQCAALSPELIIVSPLLRCLQTARLSFVDHLPTTTGIPWIAHEGCREELGLLVCNQRRPVSDIQNDYDRIDFSPLIHNEDVLWQQYGIQQRRENLPEQCDRIYDFLSNFVAQRPEHEIAIVSHSSYLFTMLNAVIAISDDHSHLKQWFLTSEVRSMKLRFISTQDY